MEFRREMAMNQGTEKLTGNVDSQVHEVVQAAQEHLRQLIGQREEIAKQISTVKRTIVGLTGLFGEDWASEELLKLIGGSGRARHPGFTKCCRTVLVEANRPLGLVEVCEELQRRVPLTVARHKNLGASAAIVLNRLVHYGEALALYDETGRRAWQWCRSGRASLEATVDDNSGSL
jgi:hypothetical protein